MSMIHTRPGTLIASGKKSLLALAVSALLLPMAQAAETKPAGAITPLGDHARIRSELVLQIHVKMGVPEDMGKGSDGQRINYPIVGGYFEGKNMKGTVIPGGADMSVERADGATYINALYRLKTDDGAVIIISNSGIWRLNAEGARKKAAGVPENELLPSDFYARTVPSFKTPPGKYAWLTDAIFVGTDDDVSDDEVLISCYEILGD